MIVRETGVACFLPWRTRMAAVLAVCAPAANAASQPPTVSPPAPCSCLVPSQTQCCHLNSALATLLRHTTKAPFAAKAGHPLRRGKQQQPAGTGAQDRPQKHITGRPKLIATAPRRAPTAPYPPFGPPFRVLSASHNTATLTAQTHYTQPAARRTALRRRSRRRAVQHLLDRPLELARRRHLEHDVAAADELAVDVQLRVRRPVRQRLEALADRLVG